jgi:hypothetical protein
MSDLSSQPSCTAYFTKYIPQLKPILGSQNAVILFDRLEYWFSKKPGGFYKFIEPCEHPLCKEGDTWADELGFSKKVFRLAFDKIGIRYKSKMQFEAESDPFKGKMFAYYQDRQTKKTIFVRNNKILSEFYAGLKKSFLNIKEKGRGLLPQPTSSTLKKVSPTVNPLVSPHGGATKDKQRTTSYNFKTKNNLEKIENKLDSPKPSEKNNDDALEMIKVWKKTIGESSLPKETPLMLTRATKALEDVFDGDMDLFEKHCLKIGSSKFLMGEKGGYGQKAYTLNFFVALSKKFKDQMDEDYFEINTRDNHAIKKAKMEKSKQDLIDDMSSKSVSEPIRELWNHMASKNWAVFKAWVYPSKFELSGDTIIMQANSGFAYDRLMDIDTYILEQIKTFVQKTSGHEFIFQKG